MNRSCSFTFWFRLVFACCHSIVVIIVGVPNMHAVEAESLRKRAYDAYCG